MKDLRKFGNIFNGSGALGFFNQDEYWYQVLLRRLGIKYKDGLTFVSKTTNMDGRPGNMELTKDYKPAHWYPDCIHFDFLTGNGLNAVSVPTPGLIALLTTGNWQRMEKPFVISLMSMAATPELRLAEHRRMADVLGGEKKHFRAPFSLELNLSCPNGEESPSEQIKGSTDVLAAYAPLEVELVPKYTVASAPIEAIMLLEDDDNCDGICVSNTWHYDLDGFGEKVFGQKVSPLKKYGGGGVSGPALRKHVLAYIRKLRQAGFTKHIRGGGGIYSGGHVREYRNAGASSCFVSTVIPTRSLCVPGIIRYANSLTWR
ncbi:MAG: hypothetical protein A3C50_04055 [Candidatus Staskawiczbacteria bacterium RIFCSPHIGHO2_02_FULL_43_16]|uniref:Dihydroorotate dehydrogenase catalytic domain-containing protein n=1 Tax=Candidatus Staskawiczbacteria bacterium RIFCSPHIGHO2_01_FULL_41_41 TaxID=1802203 RepID=A0A1G2HRF5_9BACT|nr:MAG: hypothetical protein A2822_00340 [Candidatus Staskawiczbacteria bacterium RIFCSPHIGHO2_01_FULL_41_41]OGZ68103.1 MAG: hypothetical protein A3C50_04055 [Candidatus Staskawiczbacteria bacterium RIFCSPHIGHO2_02_FULL_43_16]OGZ74841.1 MAG: hypothetical protein A3A12_03245 [Candidatus Staskawiczbacteria bacterium RIFCSPLOWO2_01_FULL_43_17b]